MPEEVRRTVVEFKAPDGKVFTDKTECLKYEAGPKLIEILGLTVIPENTKVVGAIFDNRHKIEALLTDIFEEEFGTQFVAVELPKDNELQSFKLSTEEVLNRYTGNSVQAWIEGEPALMESFNAGISYHVAADRKSDATLFWLMRIR